MNINKLIGDDWSSVVAMMPEDFESSATSAGAIRRSRKVKSASELLRLAMLYATSGGLRASSALAAQIGITDISDVALLKRLRNGARWLSALSSRLMTSRAQLDLANCTVDRRIRLVDATCVSRPGSKGTDWRLHMGYDLSTSSFDEVDITDATGGETLKRFTINPGDILVGDRGYAHRRGIYAVVSHGGDVIVRLNWSNVPLTDEDGVKFNIAEQLRKMDVGTTHEWSVKTVAMPKDKINDEIPAIPCRLIALRRTEESAGACSCKVAA